MYFTKTPSVLRALYSNKMIWEIPNRERKVYITFDDGPVPEATPIILDILCDYKVKATFFCVGHNVAKHPELFKELTEKGHSVGNHTYNHLNGWKTDKKTYFENIVKCREYVKSNLFRPPYGRLNPGQAKKISEDYKIIMWSALSGDFDHNNTGKKCVDNILKNVKTGSILLFHDSIKAKERVLYALPVVIETLLRAGYRLEPIIL